MDIWNLLTGQIVDTINIDKTRIVLEVVVVDKNTTLIISKDNENFYYFEGHSLKEKKFKHDFLIHIAKCKYCKVTHENSKITLIIQLLESDQIKSCQLNYENISSETKLEHFLFELKLPFKTSPILDIYLTDKTKFLVFHFQSKLIVLSSTEPYELLFEISLEPSITTSMFPIKGINGLVGLNTTKNLVSCVLNEETKTFNMSINENKYDSLILINEFLILRQESKLIVVKLTSETLFSLNENIVFETFLNSDRIFSQFGLSPNLKYIYFIENKRVLKFISLSNNIKNSIIEIPMYNQIRSIVCSNEFISMILQNRRVVSFLINDLNQNEKISTIRYLLV